MTLPMWLLTAWAWLKRNWKWLLLPIGVAAWLFGRAFGKKTVAVQSSALEAHDELERQVVKDAAKQKEAIRAQEQQQLSGLDAAHSAAVTAATQTVINEAADAQGDSDKVNEFLQGVSKDLRK